MLYPIAKRGRRQSSIGRIRGYSTASLAIIAAEYAARHSRTSKDLLNVSQLAVYLNSPIAKDLLFAAVAKGESDAEVLAAAYFLASSAGWERDKTVENWLQRASQLSSTDGPLKRVTIQELLDRRPEWEKRENDTWKQLNRGEIPLFLAADFLNKTLVELTLVAAFSNRQESDPRRRFTIPAFSGDRDPLNLDKPIKAIGVDPNALLTFGYLGIVEKVFDAFDEVWLAHETLHWLFQEKQRASFHQPSRIIDAHKLRDHFARGHLRPFSTKCTISSELAELIGESRASLIAEAENSRCNDLQNLIVIPGPIYKSSTLLTEEVDVTCHSSALCSCSALVDKLREVGQITRDEQRDAKAYLRLQEKPWSHQPDIADRAVLYLDELAVSHLLHLHLIDRLSESGFILISPPQMIKEMNSLIGLQEIFTKTSVTIDDIRSQIHSCIERERVHLSSRHYIEDTDKQSIADHPTTGIVQLVKHCEIIISDDRFLNHKGFAESGDSRARLCTSLDLLNHLRLRNIISSDETIKYRTLLRSASFCFVPISEDELLECIVSSPIKNGTLRETAELKAIRENYTCLRMTHILRFPEEHAWLVKAFTVFIKTLKDLWSMSANTDDAIARSEWLLALVDIRGWAGFFPAADRETIISSYRSIHIFALTIPPDEIPPSETQKYTTWVNDRVLTPIKEHHPDLFNNVIKHCKDVLEECANRLQ